MMPKKLCWDKQNSLNRVAYFVSVLFHPLFIMLYFIALVYWLNPPLLMFHDERSAKMITLSLIASTVVLPLIAIFMMKGLNLISSLDMKEKKERVGPLIVTSLFYLWIYLNLSQHSYIPDYIVYFILGTIITLFASFLINLFFKLSLHTAAIAGLITSLYIIKEQYQYYHISFSFAGKAVLINTNILIMVLILLAGFIGTSRLWLKEHTKQEIYAGYAIGITSMVVAAWKMFG